MQEPSYMYTCTCPFYIDVRFRVVPECEGQQGPTFFNLQRCPSSFCRSACTALPLILH